MEVIVPLLFLAALAGIFFAAKRGAEAAQREREQRWSQLPGLAPALGQPGAPAPPGATAATRARTNGSAAAAQQAPAPAGQQPHPAAASTARARAAAAAGAPQSTRQAGSASTRSAAIAGGAERAAGAAAAPSRPKPPAPAPISVNAAPVPELQKLPGVGVRAAERIVAHRERHGPFQSVRELEAVEGFDEHRVSRLAPRAKV